MSLPEYHCPDCDDWGCLHCYCIENTDCQSCKEFLEGERSVTNTNVTEQLQSKSVLRRTAIQNREERWFYLEREKEIWDEATKATEERIIKLLKEDETALRESGSELDLLLAEAIMEFREFLEKENK